MFTQYPRILFFITGTNPTLDEQIAAEKLAPCRVSFRNANHVPNTGALELCDGVFGEATPERYKDAYPSAKKAIGAYNKQREKDIDTVKTNTNKARADAATIAENKAKIAADVAKDEAAKAAEEATKKTDEANAASEKANAAKEAVNTADKEATPSSDAAAKAAKAWTNNA